MSPEDLTARWSGGFTQSWNDEIDSMLDRFNEQFVAGSIAGVHWDREDQGYFSMVPILETVDAMEEAFGYLAPELHKAVEEALSRSDTLWCRLYDLSLIND